MPPEYAASEAFLALVMVQMAPTSGHGKVLAAGRNAGFSPHQRVRVLGEPLFQYMERPVFHASQLSRMA